MTARARALRLRDACALSTTTKPNRLIASLRDGCDGVFDQDATCIPELVEADNDDVPGVLDTDWDDVMDVDFDVGVLADVDVGLRRRPRGNRSDCDGIADYTS